MNISYSGTVHSSSILLIFPSIFFRLNCTAMKGNFLRGRVNILNVVSGTFLVLSLIAVVAVTANPDLRQIFAPKAAHIDYLTPPQQPPAQASSPQTPTINTSISGGFTKDEATNPNPQTPTNRTGYDCSKGGCAPGVEISGFYKADNGQYYPVQSANGPTTQDLAYAFQSRAVDQAKPAPSSNSDCGSGMVASGKNCINTTTKQIIPYVNIIYYNAAAEAIMGSAPILPTTPDQIAVQKVCAVSQGAANCATNQQVVAFGVSQLKATDPSSYTQLQILAGQEQAAVQHLHSTEGVPPSSNSQTITGHSTGTVGEVPKTSGVGVGNIGGESKNTTQERSPSTAQGLPGPNFAAQVVNAVNSTWTNFWDTITNTNSSSSTSSTGNSTTGTGNEMPVQSNSHTITVHPSTSTNQGGIQGFFTGIEQSINNFFNPSANSSGTNNTTTHSHEVGGNTTTTTNKSGGGIASNLGSILSNPSPTNIAQNAQSIWNQLTGQQTTLQGHSQGVTGTASTGSVGSHSTGGSISLPGAPIQSQPQLPQLQGAPVQAPVSLNQQIADFAQQKMSTCVPGRGGLYNACVGEYFSGQVLTNETIQNVQPSNWRNTNSLYNLFWCTQLVTEAAQNAGVKLDFSTNIYTVQTMYDDFQNKGATFVATNLTPDSIQQEVKPGMVAFINTPLGGSIFDHVAIVQNVNTINTVDENGVQSKLVNVEIVQSNSAVVNATYELKNGKLYYKGAEGTYQIVAFGDLAKYGK